MTCGGVNIAEIEASAAAATAATVSDGTTDPAAGGAGGADSAGADDGGRDGETGGTDVAGSDEKNGGGTLMDASRAGAGGADVSAGGTETRTELGLTLTLGMMDGTATEVVLTSDTVTETIDGTTLILTLTLILPSGATRAGAETATELVVGRTETAGGREEDGMTRAGADGTTTTTSLLGGMLLDGGAAGADDGGTGSERIDRAGGSDGAAGADVAVAGTVLLGQTTTVVVTVTGGGHTTDGVTTELVADHVDGTAVVVNEGADPAATATAPTPAPAPDPGPGSPPPLASCRLDHGKICGTACGKEWPDDAASARIRAATDLILSRCVGGLRQLVFYFSLFH